MFARRISRAEGTPAASPADAGAVAGRDIGSDVLRFLGHHDLPPLPGNYALGHLILTHVDGLAARACDAVTMAGDRLSQADADRILAEHGPRAEPDPRDRDELRRQALRLAELAADAVASTGDFGRALAGQVDGLEGQLAGLVAAMIDRTEAIEERLDASTREIAALREEVEAARGDAMRDALTGLLNRRGALARLATADPAAGVTLAICDVDRFKSVNDRYGHVVGDRVLKLVATSLEESCRPHAVTRWGGEEFLLVFEGVTPDEAAAIVDGARDDLARRNVKLRATDEPLGPITFSAGVAPREGVGADEAIRRADARLYRAKAEGRNRVIAADE